MLKQIAHSVRVDIGPGQHIPAKVIKGRLQSAPVFHVHGFGRARQNQDQQQHDSQHFRFPAGGHESELQTR